MKSYLAMNKSTKVQTLGAVSESIICTTALATIIFDRPRAHAVYNLSTEPASRPLEASQVAFKATLDCTSTSPWVHWAASAERGEHPEVGVGTQGAGPVGCVMCTRIRPCMLTPLIHGLGHATWSAIVPGFRSRTSF